MSGKKEISKFDLMSKVLFFSTKWFHNQGFTQILPVMVSKITDPLGPDPGSSVIKTIEFEYLDDYYVLTQSMILHKQIALGKGIEKLFVLSPNIRLEHPKRQSSGKHLFEFTQLDFEIKDAKMRDIFRLMERYFYFLAKSLKEEGLLREDLDVDMFKGPYPRLYTKDLQRDYGKDWESRVSLDYDVPFWVISHKREFYDKEDPEKEGEYLNYDLIYPFGYGEALSGAEREYQYDRLVFRIKRDGLPLEKYKPYLELAKKGKLVPSAGAGFGIERLVRFLYGVRHVGDIQLFRRVPGESIMY